MVATFIAMTPNRATPRTVSIAAMRSEGAIGPVRDAPPSWNWALTGCNMAISYLAPTWEFVATHNTRRGVVAQCQLAPAFRHRPVPPRAGFSGTCTEDCGAG